MLFFLILSLFNLKPIEATYINVDFAPLKYFGDDKHISKIKDTQENLSRLKDHLTIFHNEFYKKSPIKENIISSTHFISKNQYLMQNKNIILSLISFNKSINSLFENSELNYHSLKAYKLPHFELLTQTEKNRYLNLIVEVDHVALTHLNVLQHLYVKSQSLIKNLGSLINYNSDSNFTHTHQPLNPHRELGFQHLLSEIRHISKDFNSALRSSQDVGLLSSHIEGNYKNRLAEMYNFSGKSSFNQVSYEHIYKQIAKMYRQALLDSANSSITSNPFVIKRYANQMDQVLNRLKVILTFSYDRISNDEHRIFRELKDEISEYKIKLQKESSIFAINGFLARHAQFEQEFIGKCFNIFN